MNPMIREAIEKAATTYSVSFKNIISYLKDTGKMTSLRSPCAFCSAANPPTCRDTCTPLNTFRAVTHLQNMYLVPTSVVRTAFGDITVPLRKTTVLANAGTPVSHQGTPAEGETRTSASA